MRVPYNEAFGEVFDFGPEFTGLGVGDDNTVEWSLRVASTDAAVAGYNWTTGVKEINDGAYRVLVPADVFDAPGQYTLACRTASSGGERLNQAIEVVEPSVVSSAVDDLSAAVAAIKDRTDTISTVRVLR